MLIASASDLALVMDDHGVIQDVSCHGEELLREIDVQSAWLGRAWADTVTVESRPKVESLLRDAANRAVPRWRHLNHVALRGSQLPIMYSAVQLGDRGRIVAFGRDLRPISDLQQRLVEAQQSLEEDYSRLRHVEMRYRLLFQMSAEAVLILDAASLKVTEANPAAQQLLGDAARNVLGRSLTRAFDPPGAEAVQTLLTGVRSAGRGEQIRVRLAESRPARGRTTAARDVTVSASLFREDSTSLFLVRIAPDEPEDPNAAMSESQASLLRLVESAPDGYVVVGADGRIVAANAAFLGLAQLTGEEMARGETLDRWLGREGVDVDVLIANLRQRGAVRLFATVLRGEYGASADVEVSAVAVTNGGKPCYGFAIRNIGRRLSGEITDGPPSAEHLTELIGRVPLKELVRQSTDVIEKLCIETALRMTDDNRASAAEMLGLSRQSLYVKLRRYGLGDLDPEGEEG